MSGDENLDVRGVLDDAERAVNETAQTLEGVGVNLNLIWDDMQNWGSLDEAALRSLVWMTKGVVEACVERLEAASDLLEHAKLKPYPRPEG